MKLFSALFFCLLLAAPARAENSPTKLPGVTVAGREYVKLSTWAAASGLRLRTLAPGKMFALTNATQRLVFTVNSAQAELNGVNIWLAHAVALSGSAACVSRFDLEKTLQPLAVPPRNAAGARVKTIVLDPGHGGKDPGNRIGSLAEKTYTLLLAQEVRDQLKQAGFKVTLTRTSDSFVELDNRPVKAQQAKADLFISLHFNASATDRSEVRGTEVFSLTPAGGFSTNARGEGNTRYVTGNRYNDKSLLLAYNLQKSLPRSLATEDRGVRRARFAVLREATMPAALVEAGFMSHPVEGKKIFTSSYRRDMARAIVKGILAYKKTVEH